MITREEALQGAARKAGLLRSEALHTFNVALKHVGQGKMVSSAKLCLEDAAILLSLDRWEDARKRAMTSLAYSVGFLHMDYQRLMPIQSHQQKESCDGNGM